MKPSLEIVPAWLAIADAHRHADQPGATLRALDEAVDTLVGRTLLTVLTVYSDEGIVERSYSNLTSRYPVGGFKRIGDTPRLREVLETGEVFIAQTRNDIIANYPDAQTIFETGCSSVLNVPVFWRERIVATVNLLHTEGFYQPLHVPVVRSLAQAALPAFLECLPFSRQTLS
ncbi:GAF domain-containing protein [Paraburkholderia sp. MM5384-R2]|uniref:GAF domain-containing protein n=1 Tax=Paraburkholderia sp. MM5384-R2 TaxID=2723097 RepID=UPI001612C41B|nr:GAF domain-containing protein [Paraburkholderia sp. MM5384-R2]MBB5503411.1 transcriptional regulator with GAF, ATPase, and Fis domain [Paraburkholderia sp. MM5384-R2]